VKPNNVYYHPVHQKTVEPKYVAGIMESDFDEYTPDWLHYANSIMKKADPIFRAMGWNVMQIKKDMRQRDLEEWF